MRTRVTADVSGLETTGFGHRTDPWWGTISFMALEGMGFVLAVGVFLYIVAVNPQWPLGFPPQNLLWSTSLTALFLLSLIPNWFVIQAAKAKDNAKLLPLLVLMCLIGIGTLVIRWFEFGALTLGWGDNVYGSLLWVLLGLHTSHVVTDVGDTIVMTAMFFTKHVPKTRFSDADENAMYWVFVVIAWLPLYALLYWAPRIGAG